MTHSFDNIKLDIKLCNNTAAKWKDLSEGVYKTVDKFVVTG